MEGRSKRTYRLSRRAQARVRELTGRYEVAGSQDAVVELAIDRLFREAESQVESGVWAEAAADPEFRAEADALAREFSDTETWPA
ncbi:MAG: hypothetical protein H0V73_07725 [Chloroflexi bacterium]|nr:hypothetical protein [Chloroflexota bacterium]